MEAPSPTSLQRLIVGVSGSSAPQLAWNFLCAIRAADLEVHLVISDGARRSIELELEKDPNEFAALVSHVHDVRDLAAPISSGSFMTIGMVIIPCSMNTVGALAAGTTSTLLTRAADVCLKERRRVVVVPRETPLSLIHLKNLETLHMAGAVIMPPVPAFYHRPKTIDDLLSHISGKVLDQFDIPHDLFHRWGTT